MLFIHKVVIHTKLSQIRLQLPKVRGAPQEKVVNFGDLFSLIVAGSTKEIMNE